jgi:hypothetical protein
LITLALGALVLLPDAGFAQDGEVTMFTVTDRPRIGVMVNTDAGTANDKIGATVGSVTPDGPAAKAGLGPATSSPVQRHRARRHQPRQKLVELAQRSPGDTVKVEYRRAPPNRSATIIAADLGGAAWAWTPRPDAGDVVRLRRDMAHRERAFVDMERSMAGMREGFELRFDGGGRGLDLAEMNAGLGEYFGTPKGVLVLENPSDSTVPLKAGDVILAIDGRAPATVGQARRILASYDSGDVAKFEIMRMKKKSTVSWTVPAQTHMKMPGGMRWRTAAPPGAPAAPGSMPRMKVKVAPGAPAAPAAPTPRAPTPAAPPVRT